MSIKDRLAAKSAAIGSSPRSPKTGDEQPSRPKTAPGQLMASFPLLAEKDRELESLRQKIEMLESGAAGVASSEVDISTLVEIEGRRRVLSQEEYGELRANLAANPLMYPIVYRPLGDGRNEIVAGHNRVAIYRDDLKRSKILGVRFSGSDEEVELGAAFSNLLAPSLPDFEKYRQFKRIQTKLGMSQADIIRLSGLSQSHVARILSFDHLPDAAIELIATRPHCVGGTAAAKLASLAHKGRQLEVVEAIRALVSSDEMTQEQALALATPARPKAAPSVLSINQGKRKFCDVTVREGVIGLKFAGKDNALTAKEWGDKIAQFIKSELATSKLDIKENQ